MNFWSFIETPYVSMIIDVCCIKYLSYNYGYVSFYQLDRVNKKQVVINKAYVYFARTIFISLNINSLSNEIIDWFLKYVFKLEFILI